MKRIVNIVGSVEYLLSFWLQWHTVLLHAIQIFQACNTVIFRKSLHAEQFYNSSKHAKTTSQFCSTTTILVQIR